MAIPQTVDPDADRTQKCATAHRWGMSLELVDRLTVMAARLPFGLQIISGARDRTHQERISKTPFHLSTHANEDAFGCVRASTGADVWPLVAVTNAVKATVGEAATFAGLRWGGGSSVDPETGIPADWNHLDLGPRSQTD